MQLEQLSSQLQRSTEGIYFSGPSTNEISYAAGGHAECYGVEDSSFWFRHRNNCISAMVRRHGCEGIFLDVGGGNGYVAQRLQQEGYPVVLLEPGEVGARNAHANRRLDNVVCSTLEEAYFKPSSFAGVGMFDVIEHIDDDRNFLYQVREVLKPGGRLFMTVPCHDWLWSLADIDAGHFRRHTYESLEKLLEGVFRVDYMSYFFGALVLPQYLLRALPYRIGLARGRGVLSTSSEHGADNGIAAKIVARLLDREVGAVEAGRRLGIGASCLLAATKI